MSNLPIQLDDAAAEPTVINQETGEVLALRDAPDRVLLEAAARVAELDRELLAAKRALAAELRKRHGVGATRAAGYRFTVAESTSWPVKATADALHDLAASGAIGEGDVLRCLPEKPKPDARALKALAGRLAVSDPDAARILAGACTVSPPSLRDITEDAIDAAEEPS